MGTCPNLEPLEMQEALAEGVLQEVVVPDLDEVDEHGALALALVRYQHPGGQKSRVWAPPQMTSTVFSSFFEHFPSLRNVYRDEI